MIFKKVSVKNFFRYGNNEQSLDLTGEGITGIVGNNGNGKSSIVVDSLVFALYGKYRTPTVDGVVNMYTGKNCKVSLEFSVDGQDYKIIRYRKHDTQENNLYLFKGDKDISGHTAAQTNAIILDLIKMPYIAFTNSCLFSSELYDGFLTKTNSERLAIFENILSLKEISLLYTETKNVLKELDKNRDEIVSKRDNLKGEQKTIQETIDTYSNNARSKLLEMKSNKDNYKKLIEELEKRIEELSIIDIDKEKAKLGNLTLKEEYENNVSKLIKEQKELEVNIPAELVSFFEKYKDVNFEENKLKEQKYNEDLQTISNRESGYKLSLEKLNSLKKEKAEKEAKLNFNKNKLAELNLRLEKLKSAKCPFCGQLMETHQANEEIKKANEEIKSLDNSLLEDEIKELDKKIEEENDNYNWLLVDYNVLKENLDKNFIPNSDVVAEQFKNVSSKLNELNEKKIKNSLRYEEITDEIRKINDKINSIELSKYTEEELENISEKINKQKELISNYEKEIATIDGSALTVYDKKYVDDLKSKLEIKTNELNEVNSNLKEIDDDIFHYQFLQDLFSNKSGGFKKYFIGEMISVFNSKINQYLPFFFSEKVEINFDKDLEDTIKMDDFKIDFKSFSQGQRQRAELAVSFALFEVARIYFQNDNKLLILDEVDKGLDKFGIKSMINLLNGFDKQLKIFIVSHNPLLDEEISDKIKISRDENGFSVIEK